MPVPGASVEAREMMMCAPPEAGTQVTLLQADVCLETTTSFVGSTKAWLTVASEMRTATVFIFVVVVVVMVKEEEEEAVRGLAPCYMDRAW